MYFIIFQVTVKRNFFKPLLLHLEEPSTTDTVTKIVVVFSNLKAQRTLVERNNQCYLVSLKIVVVDLLHL